METSELALIPMPGVGHLGPMIEFGKALSNRDHRIFVTVFIMEPPIESKLNSFIQSLLSNQPPPRMRFVHLTLDEFTSEYLRSKNWWMELVDINKARVKDLYASESTHRLKAFVMDMFSTALTDVASELGVPSYVFFTSNASFLSFLFHIQSLQDDHNRDITEFEGSDIEVSIPGFVNPVPTKVWPYLAFHKENDGSNMLVNVSRMMRKTKGILVNTFVELESYTIKCLSEDGTTPPIYAVGPMLNLKAEGIAAENDIDRHNEIMMWLDSQPPASIVFLCFGSMGAFEADQLVEIAHALEESGHRFLWALRRPSPKDKLQEPPLEYESIDNVLPEGFIDRTKEIGRVIGWAPQIAVLSHSAVGGFLSHCGWNSILESLWCGVPMATWPLYGEQQMNAFQMVKGLGLAVEISLDYKREDPFIMTAEGVKRGIKHLMEASKSTELKRKVKVMKEMSRRAVMEGGSSYAAMAHFIEEVLNSSP